METNEVEFINLTGREINVYATDDCSEVIDGDYKSLVAKDGAKPIRVIPPSGTVAKVSQIKRQVTTLDGIPVNKTTLGKIEGLPRMWKFNRLYIVSELIAQAVATRNDVAMATRNDVLVIDSEVRDKNGNVIGCTSFGKIVNPYE